MRAWLHGFFVAVFAAMAVFTTAASLDRNVLVAIADLWQDLWFRATLADAYFAFLTIWFWIAYRENRWLTRISWLIGILLLGNFAIAAYAWWALRSLPQAAPLWHVLLRPDHRPQGQR